MKKLIILFFSCVMSLMAVQAENNVKFQIKGPLKKYNTLRVINQTEFSNFGCVVYLLEQQGDKMVVSSTLATCSLKAKGDMDTKEYIKINQDEWIGVKLLDENMQNVSINISYKNYPFVNMVELTISDDNALQSGAEF